MVVTTHKTPNGYAVVVNQRFDTRALLARFTNVELKKTTFCATTGQQNNNTAIVRSIADYSCVFR